MLTLWQNTITESPGCIMVLPDTSRPTPSRTSPPMVMPTGRPRSFTGFCVTFEPSDGMNSATSAWQS